ncbi:SHOCT domain-containing protein, partial [Streptomyces sp. NPDC060131]|uniref:SHOCT domain-containing protein n=1 Tax=Streptomyces sp. NPDC060131 TaxID=3347058 RepID=UPI00365D49A2
PAARAALEDALVSEDTSTPATAPPAPAAEDDHDALLRRLRELGDLHRSGVLTDEEFALAKQAVLKRM